MQRRSFLKLVGSGAMAAAGVACAGEMNGDDDAPGVDGAAAVPDAAAGGPDGAAPDAAAAPCVEEFVLMYDTNAQAMYMDGTLGPLTGVIEVEYVLANVMLTLQFWHGHGGAQHQFTLTPEHFAMLKAGMRVYVTTSVVDGHTHQLFIDPTDPSYRVDGAQPVMVPLGLC